MGREEIGKLTRTVSPFVCNITILAQAIAIAIVFKYPPSNNQPLETGFIAEMFGATVIFVFSYAYGNTSLIDPTWYLFPLAVGTGWFTSGNGVSTRGLIAYGLLGLWVLRFFVQWPWEGWSEGITHEDWRFVDFQKKISSPCLYWIFSLIGFHLIPSALTFLALSPVEKVWTAGQDAEPLGPLDAMAFAVTFAAIVFAYVADKQMSDFRQGFYGQDVFLDHAEGQKKICREGLWAYSRHPNYFGEILFWVGMAMIGHAGDPHPENTCVLFSVGGAVGVWMLFQFYSVPEMDRRNLKHRDGY